ncbi:MAG: serine/threonine transporter SstT [Prevotella sp.]|nr:serine/threonine transporter SstT [Candidatus Prevotella equi]
MSISISRIVDAYRDVNLMLRIFIGLLIGAALGLTIPGLTGVAILGNLFVGALKAMAPILVALLVASSIAKAREGLGKRFRTVIILYMSSTLIAAIVAVMASRLFPVSLILPGTGTTDAAPSELGDVFMKLAGDLMSNPVTAVSSATYLSILFWAIIIGLALKKRASDKTITMIHEMADSVTLVVHWIIHCAPFGIMGLVYSSVADSGLEIFTTYGKLVLLLVGCMLTTSLLINPIISSIMLRRNAYPLLWKCLKGSAVSAFFTRSSAANIPVNMSLCNRLGLNEDFYSVSIPLGCTINMDGAAVTITVMTLATCTTLGIDVSLGSAIVLSILSALAACGASGVAGGSLLLIPMACSLFGIPQDISMQVVAVGFIISVIQDSVETALNSSGDVMFTATADFFDRQKQGEKISFQ